MGGFLNPTTINGRFARACVFFVVALGLTLVTACGSPQTAGPASTASASAGASSTTQSGTGAKPTLRIGSKDFTEQIVINEMAAALLEDAGYQVERKMNLGGSAVVHQALVSGEIDTYVEYTGTGLTAILKLPVQTDPQQVYDTVKQEYESKFQLTWLKPLGFNNTYAMAMTKEKAADLGITNVSDLKAKAESLVFGGTQEFLTRPDGLPGLSEKYGLKFKDSKGLDPGIMYQAVDTGQVDVISAFATDGRIPALGLVTLQDDQQFFPPYFAASVIRQDTLAKDGHIAEVLNQLGGKINDQTMANLNLQVDQEKKEAADVAKTFLKEQGLTK
jgi:glycine betaine/choline ABC-type transport system substrate-binding protein